MSKKVVLTMTNGQQLNLEGIDELYGINDAINDGETVFIYDQVAINTRHIIHARLEEK